MLTVVLIALAGLAFVVLPALYVRGRVRRWRARWAVRREVLRRRIAQWSGAAKRGATSTKRGAVLAATTAKKGAASSVEIARMGAERAGEMATGLLASDLAAQVNATVQSMVDGATTAYDRAMDAEYLATHVGGGLHRLMDGGHTLWGSVKAAATADTGDGLLTRTAGWATAYAKDLSTSAGMPIVTMSRDTYLALADRAAALGVSRERFADLVSFDAAEAFGAVVGALALALRWSDAQAKDFARVAAGTGLAATMASNPLLACVSVVAAAKAYVEADGGDWRECAQSALTGVAVTGASMAAGSAVAAAGGGVLVVLLAGIVAAGAVDTLAERAAASRQPEA